MADEENYSEEEFGLSEDFEEESEEESEEPAAVEEEFEMEEDVEEAPAAAPPSSGNKLMRYALFIIGLVAIGYGGYQFYEMFTPSFPTSAFDKKIGGSFISQH